jgi:hypothetical protein
VVRILCEQMDGRPGGKERAAAFAAP